MVDKNDLEQKGYSKAEVEILLALNTLQVNQVEIMQHYVRKSDFEPIQRLVYGLVAIILVAVASGLVAMVIK